ncbi:LapA family protein [Oscillatoria sp. FACHB-1407]|uniref:LapA family protein n=1 Tax=Oscillatoria sp. FACHB-1407 TaxID=2692847 RepID=UPI0016850CE4|nr:LapA family protein [Oscillatoria sp. FACHB-1407]MBD2463304.1 LapA family protein [Oscillatoria sp. FACHB-1407]
MVRLVLVLAIAGGLTLFALQNLTPISLVILGVASQPLPLAVWLLGAIVSGALTTLLISGLFSASNAFAAPRSARKRSPKRVSTNSSPRWNAAWSNPKADTPKPPRNNPRAATPTGDDWEPRPPLEEWEDWEGYEEPAKSSSTAQTSYASDSYARSESRYSQPDDFVPTAQEQEVWDDWDEDEPEDSRYEDRPLTEEDSIPRRTDFEVRQEPVARYQSGTIYSYSYRNQEDREDSSVGKTEDVYDAEFRVITPPYNAEPEEPTLNEPEPIYEDKVEPVNNQDDEEDWLDDEEEYDEEEYDEKDDDGRDDEDDWDDSDDRNRRDRPKGDSSDDW